MITLFKKFFNTIAEQQKLNPSCMGCMQPGVHRTDSTEQIRKPNP